MNSVKPPGHDEAMRLFAISHYHFLGLSVGAKCELVQERLKCYRKYAWDNWRNNAKRATEQVYEETYFQKIEDDFATPEAAQAYEQRILESTAAQRDALRRYVQSGRLDLIAIEGAKGRFNLVQDDVALLLRPGVSGPRKIDAGGAQHERRIPLFELTPKRLKAVFRGRSHAKVVAGVIGVCIALAFLWGMLGSIGTEQSHAHRVNNVSTSLGIRVYQREHPSVVVEHPAYKSHTSPRLVVSSSVSHVRAAHARRADSVNHVWPAPSVNLRAKQEATADELVKQIDP